MAVFAVEFTYNVDRDQRQQAHPAHVAYLTHLTERGVLLLAGPLVGANAGLLVYEVDNEEELRVVLNDEPYVRAGFVAATRVRQWKPGKGSLAGPRVPVPAGPDAKGMS